jgi:hypothetical protein
MEALPPNSATTAAMENRWSDSTRNGCEYNKPETQAERNAEAMIAVRARQLAANKEAARARNRCAPEETETKAEYEARLQALAAEHGLPYRTLEEREAYAKELEEAMAAKRAATASASNAVRSRSDYVTEKTEMMQEARSEAEVLRVGVSH